MSAELQKLKSATSTEINPLLQISRLFQKDEENVSNFPRTFTMLANFVMTNQHGSAAAHHAINTWLCLPQIQMERAKMQLVVHACVGCVDTWGFRKIVTKHLKADTLVVPSRSAKIVVNKSRQIGLNRWIRMAKKYRLWS